MFSVCPETVGLSVYTDNERQKPVWPCGSLLHRVLIGICEQDIDQLVHGQFCFLFSRVCRPCLGLDWSCSTSYSQPPSRLAEIKSSTEQCPMWNRTGSSEVQTWRPGDTCKRPNWNILESLTSVLVCRWCQREPLSSPDPEVEP